jgi:hypothetical protein
MGPVPKEAGPLLGLKSRQRPDRSNPVAKPPPQPPYRVTRNPAQRRDRHPGSRGQRCPAAGPKPRRPGMTGSGKGGRQKSHRRAVARGAPKVRQRMRRAGHQPRTPRRAGPSPRPQMNPGTQGRGQPHIPCHHQRQPPRPANTGERTTDRDSVGVPVMPQHHPGDALRQTGSGRKRVRQPIRIGEQPQHRWGFTPQPPGSGATPGKELQVHASPHSSCVGLSRPSSWAHCRDGWPGQARP